MIAKTRLPIAEPFRGGLEAFTYTLCKEYVRCGHNVTLYAHADSDPKLPIKSFYGDTFRDNKNYAIYEHDEYLSVIQDIEQGGFDVVHNNSTHELPLIWGARAAIPVVTTLHTPPLTAMKAAISIASLSNNLRFITVSQALKHTWQPYTANGSTVLYNGVDLKRWPLTRRSNDYLLWYGRMVHPKGLDIALDAAHQVGIPLHFAGSIDDTAYYEEQIVPRMHLNDRYLGHLDQSAILAAMDGAAALVNAARWEEPFGLTNIEAMSAGVPIAGFDRGAFSELINPDCGAIASGTTVSSLARAIEAAIPLDGRLVRKQAERFSLHTLGQQYLDYFEGLL